MLKEAGLEALGSWGECHPLPTLEDVLVVLYYGPSCGLIGTGTVPKAGFASATSVRGSCILTRTLRA